MITTVMITAWVRIPASQPKRLYPGAGLPVNTLSVVWLSMICLFIVTRRCGPLPGLSSSFCGGLQARQFFWIVQKKKAFYTILAEILVIFCDQ